MKALDAGLMTALSVPGVTGLATGGVHRLRVPRGTSPPYLTFAHDPSADEYALGDARAFETYPVTLHAVDVGQSASVAQDIVAAAWTALLSLSVTGHTVISTRRRTTAEYVEDVEGVVYQHVVWTHDIILDPN